MLPSLEFFFHEIFEGEAFLLNYIAKYLHCVNYPTILVESNQTEEEKVLYRWLES